MKKLTLFIAAIAFMNTFLFSSCKKENDKGHEIVTGSAQLSGTQQTPPVSTSASGAVNISYNKTTKQLTFTASWTNLSSAPTSMNFHGPALAGNTAPAIIAVNKFSATTSGSVSTTFPVTNNGQVLESDLLSNKWYFNVTTVNNPQGEIRGQVNF